MSAVVAEPQLIAEAATDLTTIDSALGAAHLWAATPTQAVLPAAADEVSDAVAQLFSQHGQDYQAAAGQAAAYQREFVQHLTSAAGSYASAEATNASLLRPVAATAAAIPSLDQILDSLISNLTALFWQSLALLYYALFLMLIPIYAALAIYLPFAYLGSIFGV